MTITLRTVKGSRLTHAEADGNIVDLRDGKAANVHEHAADAITSGTFDDARISAANVTQHQAALSIGPQLAAGLVSAQAGNQLTAPLKEWVGTQAAYDALAGSYDPGTRYSIVAG